jgi:ankyrin repeat protein
MLVKVNNIRKNEIYVVLAGFLVSVLVPGCKGENARSTGQPNTVYEAAEIGDKAAVEKFLAEGTSPDSKDQFGATALHYAAAYGQAGVVELLLAKGANVDATNPGGGTPLGEAAMGVGRSEEVARLLIASGADVNARNRDGRTVLHKAVMSGNPAVLEVLLSNGADDRVKDKDGVTPLERAVGLATSEFRPGSLMAKRKKQFQACVEILRRHREM